MSADKEKDAWAYNLRKNNVLTWIEDLERVLKYKQILNDSPMTSTLEIESGIVRINPKGHYISHNFVPHVKAGFRFDDIATIMKSEIVKFEYEYGTVNLTAEDIRSLRNAIYYFNKKFSKVDMNDRKNLLHMEQTGEVLYYLLGKTISFTAQTNGWCTLTFANNNNSTKDYCTIFSDEQINLLERVNKAIRTRSYVGGIADDDE